MTITYQYIINSISAYASYEGQTNCVYYIMWSMSGTDGSRYITLPRGLVVPYDPNTPYIPADQLTLATLISWIETHIPESELNELKDIIANDLAYQATLPAVVNIPVPTT